MECYTLFSGSSGNCIFIRAGETSVLIDAGGNAKRIKDALLSVGGDPDRLNAILITHEHVDHTAALPVLLKGRSIPVFCQEKVARALYMGYQDAGKTRWAADFARCVRTVSPGAEYEAGEVIFSPFKTPHDSVDSEGFVLQEGALAVATDLGHVSDEVRRAMLGCRRAILEANHDLEMLWNGAYPYRLKERVASDFGHLNNFDCAAFLVDLFREGCRDFTLFHLSQDNNTPDLALSAARKALTEAGIDPGEYGLRAAARYEVTCVL